MTNRVTTQGIVSEPPGKGAPDGAVRPHPRRITWVGASALALGGSNQSIFLIGALLASQGSAAVPLLGLGLLLSYMATPGWIELSCMFPNRVGGIAATCAEAFRPYSPVLANLTGVCYWWGWVPTCGLTAIFSADAIHQWYLPGVPTKLLATLLVLVFMGVNLCGLRWAVRLAKPIALIALALALCSSMIPVIAGTVDWHRAFAFHLDSPFAGAFGHLTSAMAGLYLIGFAAPAFEAAACHIGEMKDPAFDQPRALWVSGAVASIFFVAMPVVWLGVFGSSALEGNLASLLGPTFAPLFGGLAKAGAIWFIAFNMFSGTLQPLSGASRTLSQLSEDGLLPRSVGFRSAKTDAPMVAIVLTAVASIVFLLAGDPTSIIAAANLTYLIGIALPSVAVWILRHHEPNRVRTYRARDGSIRFGLVAAAVWLSSTLLGFEQFGLPIVILGLVMAYSGSLAFAWRLRDDRRRTGVRGPRRSIHFKLTGAMLAVLALDGIGYLVAVNHVSSAEPALVALLKDIFVAVGLLTISVGLILPGMIAHTANQVAQAADDLANGTLLQLTEAMEAMSSGDLDHAHAEVVLTPVLVRSDDEFGKMAGSFNVMQEEAARAANALDEATDQLRVHRDELEQLVQDRTSALLSAYEEVDTAHRRRRDLHDRMRALSAKLAAAAGRGSDLPSTMVQAVEALGSVVEVDLVAVFLTDATGALGAVAATWYRAGTSVPDLAGSPLLPEISSLLDAIAEPRQTVAIGDLAVAPMAALPEGRSDDVERLLISGLGVHSAIFCPFPSGDGTLLGLLLIGSTVVSDVWNDDDLALVDAVGIDLGSAVAQSSLYEDQREVVRQLQDLDRARSEFLSTFSHELRTPLTNIRAYVELLRQGAAPRDPGDERMLEIIEQNSARLSDLIEDILMLSQLNAAVMEVELRPLLIDPLVALACEAVRPAVESKQLDLVLALDAPLARVNGVAGQLERLVLNLLTNAIKFTGVGGRISVSTDTSLTALTIVVADTGVGIPEPEQVAVFGRFYRGAEATREVVPGSGLGLAIVQSIVEHHHGSIALASTPGEGTSVRVSLPLVQPAAPDDVELVHGAGGPSRNGGRDS